MALSLFQHGAIRTTAPKAKELRRFVEKIITQARKATLHARRLVTAELGDRLMADNEEEILDQTVVQKLFTEIAPRYANRPGGYTRIIRLSDRRIGDAAEQVLLQLVEETQAAPAGGKAGSTRRRRRAGKRRQLAEGVQAPQGADAPPAEPSADGQGEAPASSEETSAGESQDQTKPE